MKTKDPIEEFKKIMESENQPAPVDIEKLPAEMRNWYRA